ncbi:hypothetical protein L6452_35606 [Arctium lappa]|uniref:Uncharacterized protein n=1 Tax=Arctium lappa TaxID=4217 RepID=A0ACB8Y7L8_ARCLA|nr:hypothetical protein L6452_35606 [Arctium lappa]
MEETDSFNPGSLVKHLRESMSQVLHSADIDPQYQKKLLDVLVKMMFKALIMALHQLKTSYIIEVRISCFKDLYHAK